MQCAHDHGFAGRAAVDAGALHEGVVMAGSSILAMISFFGGIKLFKKHMFVQDIISEFKPFEKVLANKYYVDELYNVVVINPIKIISNFCASMIDKNIIDGAVNGIGSQVKKIGTGLRVLQTGDIQSYAFMMIMGLLLAILFILKILV